MMKEEKKIEEEQKNEATDKTENNLPKDDMAGLANTKFDYSTQVNDPDLLVGPYMSKDGEVPTVKCPNCGEEMPATINTCVNCGHYLKKDEDRYKPMDEKKIKRIRWIITIVCLVAFVLYMIFKNK